MKKYTVALVEKGLYYVDIIKLYVILVLQILLLYVELLPVENDWPAITTLF